MFFFVFFIVVFLLLLKHKRTKLQIWCTSLRPCVACGLVRVRHTPFPGQSECFVAVLLTLAVLLSIDSYWRCFLLEWILHSEVRRVMSTASNSSLKQSCSALTSVTSALEVIFNVMRSINPRYTYLLTYLLFLNTHVLRWVSLWRCRVCVVRDVIKCVVLSLHYCKAPRRYFHWMRISAAVAAKFFNPLCFEVRRDAIGHR